MKTRKFYPAQVIRRLNGRAVSTLTASDRAALNIGVRRARKAGVIVTVVEGVIAVYSAKQVGQMIMADLKDVANLLDTRRIKEQAEAVNANTRIFMNILS